MMEALLEVAAFAAKATIVVIAVSATSFLVFHLGRGEARDEQHGRLKVSRLDVRLLGLRDALRVRERSKKEWKALRKQRQEEADARAEGPTTYLLEFQGDLEPSQARSLSRCVTAICLAAGDGDDVLVRLESPGGTVPGYGLAAAQLQRLKEAGLSLTVCIDRVAASGGYMMAVVADEIVAAPLAVVGSIGVLLPVPNVHRWLKERGVEYDEMTAGEYKRTVSLAGEITPEGRAKTQAQLDETHALFKKHITRHRPALDIESVDDSEAEVGPRRSLDLYTLFYVPQNASKQVPDPLHIMGRANQHTTMSLPRMAIAHSSLDIYYLHNAREPAATVRGSLAELSERLVRLISG